MPPENLDQDVVKLAKAIRNVESGGNYDAKGGSGEFGAYQYMPDSWKQWAGQYLKNPSATPDKINQNKVAYYRIKELKDQGYKPDQIASIWNSGKPEWRGNVGINKYGVKYDTPGYVSKVKAAYLEQPAPQYPQAKILPGENVPETPQDQANRLGQYDAETAAYREESRKAGGLGGFIKEIGKTFAGSAVGLGKTIGAAASTGKVSDTLSAANTRQTGATAELAKRISEKKARGEDTTRLEQELNRAQGATLQMPSVREINPALNKTNSQVVGEVAGTALEALSGRIGKGAVDAASKTAGNLLSGATAKNVALGTGLGYALDVTQGLQGNRGENRTGMAAAIPGVGTAVGVGTAGLLGAAKVGSALTRKVANAYDPEAIAQKGLDEAIELTAPVLNKKGSIQAFERSGMPGGVESQGALGTYKTTATPRQIEIAQSVQDIVSKKKGPIDNIVSINENIASISEKEIAPFLEANPAPFNVKTLNAYLRDTTEIPDFIKADSTLQNMYDLTRQRMLAVAEKYPKTTKGLWDARKEFDALAESQSINLDPMSTQANTIKQAVQDTRRAVNDFIAKNTPGGDENFTAKLRQLSNMYAARGNIAEQNYKLLDRNVVSRYLKQNPTKAKFLRGFGTVAATGLGLGGTSWLLGD
jgi:hypothetical protein